MHIDPIHVGQVTFAHALVVGTQMTTRSDRTPRTVRRGLLQRFMRWLSKSTMERTTHTAVDPPIQWPECVGRPHVIGAGTFLVMTYLRAQSRSIQD